MIFFIILTAFVALLSYNYFFKRRHLPPGPAPLPIVGNVLTLAKEERWERKFTEWSHQYGPIFTYWLGELPIVAVCDYQDMIKYFVKHADVFSDRMVTNNAMDEARGGQHGIGSNNGDPWREHRRFTLKVLRDFGLGKNQMEERILSELHILLEKVNKDLDAEEIDFFNYSDIAVGSIINAIVAGYKFTEGHEDEFYHMKRISSTFIKAFTNPAANLVFNNPKLMNVPIISSTPKQAIGALEQIFAFLDTQVQKHVKENDYNVEVEAHDYIDAYLIERQRQINKEGTEGHFTFIELKNVCMDLWFAGQETTSSTITWLIAYMIRYPEVQKKLQEELDSVIGSKRIIRNSDRVNLPYTNAVIMESQRCSNIVAQNMPRCLAEDIELDGRYYKKGTVFVPQISVLLQNPKVFPHPSRFNPSRFIDENGKLKQVEELIPFSIGKRICLGEGMARMELFIFTANLFNQYKFSAGKVAPSLKKPDGGASICELYKCRIQLR